MGLLCVQEDPDDRPAMPSVILMLQGIEATLPPPSKEPAFSTLSNAIDVSYSTNATTVSIPEGR